MKDFSVDKKLFFSSPYMIELSNCLLNILSLLKEKIDDNKTYLMEEMKLNNILRTIINKEKIDDLDFSNIKSKINNYLNNQYKKIILLSNPEKKSIDDIYNLVIESGGVINNKECDIIDLGEGKIGILIDYFDIKKLNKSLVKPKEEEKPKNPEYDMWECSNCHQLNDKDNESCVYCDAPKVIAPKMLEIKKRKSEVKISNLLDNSKI